MSDKALDLAYAAHRKYLDADSSDSGPIEDYIAEAIRQAVRLCVGIAEDERNRWLKDRAELGCSMWTNHPNQRRRQESMRNECQHYNPNTRDS